VITPETSEFGPAVLRSLAALVPAGMTQADLALELGLSAHLQMSDIEVDDAIAQMWAVRQAILEAGDMDPSAEPIPFGGRCGRLDLLNMAIYLGNLVERAATLNDCNRDAIVARAMVRPVIQQVRVSTTDLRQLRTS
jgi:hypothetical protein